MKNKTLPIIIVLSLSLALLAGYQTPASVPPATEKAVATEPATQAAIANPASENCIKQGGTLSIEERGDQGQIGVCYFEDNRQCEEWALMRGECPVGGVNVTGYVTEAGRYCAITGGEYAATGNNGAQDELGTCTFMNGAQCDAWDYYYGRCTPESAATTTSPSESAVVRFARGILVEEYALEPGSIEQRFVLHAPPPLDGGDLVFEGVVSCDAAFAPRRAAGSGAASAAASGSAQPRSLTRTAPSSPPPSRLAPVRPA